MPDVIASTANNLKKDGWVTGQTWGYEVVVPANFNFMLADHERWMTIREWERLGIKRAGAAAFPRPDDRAFLLVPAGVQGPGLPDAGQFPRAHEIQPGRGLCAGDRPSRRPSAWRRRLRAAMAALRAHAVSRDERLELQQLLARQGYDVEPDGHLGARTRAAIRDFQAKTGQVPDGFASAVILDKLRSR